MLYLFICTGPGKKYIENISISIYLQKKINGISVV